MAVGDAGSYFVEFVPALFFGMLIVLFSLCIVLSLMRPRWFFIKSADNVDGKWGQIGFSLCMGGLALFALVMMDATYPSGDEMPVVEFDDSGMIMIEVN